MTTLIKSELFENLEYAIEYNGFSRQLLAETGKFNKGSAYAPNELFEGNQLAIAGTMFEGSQMYTGDDSGYYVALLNDCYSLEGLKTTLEKLLYLAYYRKGSKPFDIILEGGEVLTVRCDDMATAKRLIKRCQSRFSFEVKTIIEGVDKLTDRFIRDQLRGNSHILSKGAIGKTEFQLPDNMTMTSKISDGHYYKWLDVNVTDCSHNTIETRHDYLRSLGFNSGLHFLSEDNLLILKGTLDIHFKDNYKVA